MNDEQLKKKDLDILVPRVLFDNYGMLKCVLQNQAVILSKLTGEDETKLKRKFEKMVIKNRKDIQDILKTRLADSPSKGRYLRL